MISETYGEDRGGDGSARRAIMALKMAGELAESMGLDQITNEVVRKALAEQEASSIPVQEIESLGLHELLILKAVATAVMEGVEVLTAGELRRRYEVLCESYRVKPRGYTQFYVYVRHLASMGLLEIRLSGKGMRGRTTLIRLTPPIPADRLNEVVERAITMELSGEGEWR
jgi:cell division control protein 6